LRLSHLVYATAGYVLGARAGRERYDQIVRVARRVAGSQTVQATAGVVQAQLDATVNRVAARTRHALVTKLPGSAHERPTAGVNGYRH
jgi:hypothetical protein